jgi:GTP-binding protein LepA
MPDIPRSHIRNFSIIAHIDHGKSTLADRLLALGKLTDERTGKDQILDSMDIERERGITIKAQILHPELLESVKMARHTFLTSSTLLAMLTSPMKFHARCAACEGARCCSSMRAQGVQAQTLANFYLSASKPTTYIVVPVHQQDRPAFCRCRKGAPRRRSRKVTGSRCGTDAVARIGQDLASTLKR